MPKPPFLTMIGGLLLAGALITAACDDEGEVTGIDDQSAALIEATGAEADQHLAMLEEKLDLADEQVAQLRAIFEEQRPKFHALRQSAPEDREAQRQAFRALRAETHERVSAVLTDEQEQRLGELFRSHGKGHGPLGRWDPEQHLARLQEELDLTDEQVAQIRAIFEEHRAKVQALRESAPDDRDARHEAFHELHQEVHDRVRAVLTEEQRERFDELKDSHARSRGLWGRWHEKN